MLINHRLQLPALLILLICFASPLSAQGTENAIAAGMYIMLFTGFVAAFGGLFLLYIIFGFLFANKPDEALRKKIFKNSALYSFLTAVFFLLLALIALNMF